MRYYEILSETVHYDPQAIYLHGGPAVLKGGRLQRYMKEGSDMGALFFIRESPVGWHYATAYAIMKSANSGVYRVHLKIPKDKVFDFSDDAHRRFAQSHLTPQEFDYWVTSSRDGFLDWAVMDEDVLIEWGFRGAVLMERQQGFAGYGEHALSIAVFDPNDVEIVDFVPKAEALKLAHNNRVT